MVAPNTQVFPLQHHLKGSNASTSFRNYSRIQSEMQKDGFEVHKENLLSLSLSKNSKQSGAGEKSDAIAPSGCPRIQGTSERTGLPSVLSMRVGTPPQGLNVQDNEYDAHHACLSISGDVAPGIANIPPCIAASSSSAALQPLASGEEAMHVYNIYAEMFTGAYTPVSSCAPASNTHGEREFCPSRPPTAENMEVVQFLPDVKSVKEGEEDNAKRLRVNAYPACGGSPTAELSKALPIVGLKLFTASAHAQMPKALVTFSEGEPSLPLSLEHSLQQANSRPQRISTPMHENSCTEADWGKFLALSATPVANETDSVSARVLPFQRRFKQLQAFLKQCDEVDQNEGMQALRSLSAAARSGHAVELETRAIRLSLEEGKEIKRMRLLNVLGKISERSLDDAGATPHGPRLPAPGAAAKLKSIP